MPELNCSNCGCDISKYKNYYDSPCATCKLAKEYYKLPKAIFFDSSENSSDQDEMDENDAAYYNPGVDSPIDTVAAEELDEEDNIKLSNIDETSMKILREAIERQILVSMSGAIMKLLAMSRSNPVMFEIIIKKMQFPHMSYAEIGETLNPPVTKQIVLYNLKRAIEKFPELSSVFITDTRFSSGKMALETVAAKNRREVAIEKLKGVLYGDDESLKSMAMKEINAIIHSPCFVSSEVMDFNWYADDADALRRARISAKNKEKLGI